jgi:hypothetical protein
LLSLRPIFFVLKKRIVKNTSSNSVRNFREKNDASLTEQIQYSYLYCGVRPPLLTYIGGHFRVIQQGFLVVSMFGPWMKKFALFQIF